jgi:hypothetical protein
MTRSLEDDFLAVILGEEPQTPQHAISPGPFPQTFTVCGRGGWCSEDPEKVTCPDCIAILDGRAEPLPQPLW